MDEAVASYVKKEFSVLIGDRTSEDIKLNLGSAIPTRDLRECPVRGREMVTRLARNVVLRSAMVYETLQPPIQAILNAIRFVLEKTPPELAGDIMKSGIHLTGGGANLFGLDQYIASELGIPVLLARNSESCTIRGVGELTDNIELLHRIGRSSFLRDDEEE